MLNTSSDFFMDEAEVEKRHDPWTQAAQSRLSNAIKDQGAENNSRSGRLAISQSIETVVLPEHGRSGL
jgi:hypothetical protein